MVSLKIYCFGGCTIFIPLILCLVSTISAELATVKSTVSPSTISIPTTCPAAAAPTPLTTVQLGNALDWKLSYDESTKDLQIVPVKICASLDTTTKLKLCGQETKTTSNIILKILAKVNDKDTTLTVATKNVEVALDSLAFCAVFSPCEILQALKDVTTANLSGIKFAADISIGGSVLADSTDSSLLRFLEASLNFNAAADAPKVWNLSAGGSKYITKSSDIIGKTSLKIIGSLVHISPCKGAVCPFILGGSSDQFQHLEFEATKLPVCKTRLSKDGVSANDLKLIEFYDRNETSLAEVNIEVPIKEEPEPPTTTTTTTRTPKAIVPLVGPIASENIINYEFNPVMDIPTQNVSVSQTYTIGASDLKFAFNGKYLNAYPVNICGESSGKLSRFVKEGEKNPKNATQFILGLSVKSSTTPPVTQTFEVTFTNRLFCRSFDLCKVIELLNSSKVTKATLPTTQLEVSILSDNTYNADPTAKVSWKFRVYSSAYFTSEKGIIATNATIISEAFYGMRHGVACSFSECSIHKPVATSSLYFDYTSKDDTLLPKCLTTVSPMAKDDDFTQIGVGKADYANDQKYPGKEERLQGGPNTVKEYGQFVYKRTLYGKNLNSILKYSNCPGTMETAALPLEAFNIKVIEAVIHVSAFELCGSTYGSGAVASCSGDDSTAETALDVELKVGYGTKSASTKKKGVFDVKRKAFCIQFEPCDVYSPLATLGLPAQDAIKATMQFSVNTNVKLVDAKDPLMFIGTVTGSSVVIKSNEAFSGLAQAVRPFSAERRGDGCTSAECGFIVGKDIKPKSSFHLYHPENSTPQCVVQEKSGVDPVSHSIIDYFVLTDASSEISAMKEVNYLSEVHISHLGYFKKGLLQPFSIEEQCTADAAPVELTVGPVDTISWTADDSKVFNFFPLTACFKKEGAGAIELCEVEKETYSLKVSANFKSNNEVKSVEKEVTMLKKDTNAICVSFDPCTILKLLEDLGVTHSTLASTTVSISANFSPLKAAGSDVSWKLTVMGSRYVVNGENGMSDAAEVVGSFMTLRKRAICQTEFCSVQIEGLDSTYEHYLVEGSEDNKLPTCQPRTEKNVGLLTHSILQYFENPVQENIFQLMNISSEGVPPISPPTFPPLPETKTVKEQSRDGELTPSGGVSPLTVYRWTAAVVVGLMIASIFL